MMMVIEIAMSIGASIVMIQESSIGTRKNC